MNFLLTFRFYILCLSNSGSLTHNSFIDPQSSGGILKLQNFKIISEPKEPCKNLEFSANLYKFLKFKHDMWELWDA